MPSICILVLNYNSALESIHLYNEILSFNRIDLSIFVIDNNSRREDRKLLIKNVPKDTLILNSRNLGYAAGNTRGINLAIENEFEYIFLLNPDIRLNKDVIDRLLFQLEKNQNIAVIGPRICYRENQNLIYSDGGVVKAEKGFLTDHLNCNRKVHEVENPGLHTVDYVNGSCFLLRASIWEKIGGMREDFFLYFEETEWCLRAKKAGFLCMVDSEVAAYHLSSSKTLGYHFYMTRNRILLAKNQNEYIIETICTIAFSIFQELYRDLRKLKMPSSESFAKLKGVLAGIIMNVTWR